MKIIFMQPQLPQLQESFWRKGKPRSIYSKLSENIDVDVAIVGGGVAGLTTAYVLKQSGLRVAVVEKHTIASGTTGGTTGKVTAQHGLIYAELHERFGAQKTKTYAEAYQAAMEDIEQLITSENISCDWARADNYIYTTKTPNIAQFQKETVIAQRYGLPASFETKLDLPFKVAGAVKFKNQAKFNAVKYSQNLAQLVHGNGSYIFENSNVIGMQDGSRGRIYTTEGAVNAKDIVVATKVPAGPLMARVTYAAIEYPETSYVVAGKIKYPLNGMYISPDTEHYSLLPVQEGKNTYLFVGGQNHIPGLGSSEPNQKVLAEYAAKWFGINTIEYRWKAMDYIAYDKLPVVGKLYPWSKHMYVITGFKKWGLSTSMVAAHVIRSLLYSEPTKAAKLFTPHRPSTQRYMLSAMKEYLQK